MTGEELLIDLEERIDRGILALHAERLAKGEYPGTVEWGRLTAKMDGMLVVKDWLRSYR